MAAKTIKNDWHVKKSKKYTLDEFFTSIYLPHAKTRKKSWRLDECLERCYISATFGHVHLAEIAPFSVECWLTQLREKGLAASTCNRILALFKSLCALAERCGLIPYGTSPCREVRKLKVPPSKIRYLSVDEGRRLMKYLRGMDKTEARVIELLLLTGARRSEILHARWENLDLEHRVLTIPNSKSGKTRYIYLSTEAVKIFEKIGNGQSGCIFPGRKNDKPVSTIYQFWRKTRDSLSLTGVRIHDLRHTYASYLVSEGHSLYETQQLLGHSDPRMTMRYAHFAQESLLNATECVANILEKPSDTRSERGTDGRSEPHRKPPRPPVKSNLAGTARAARHKRNDRLRRSGTVLICRSES